jgi:hypothetical protein
MVHPEALGGGPHRASARDGKKIANVIPVDHGAILHRQGAPSNARVQHVEQPMW